MSLRTDKISGIVTCVFGCVMIGFGAFGLMTVGMQHILVQTMPPMQNDPDHFPFDEVMNTVHGILCIYLPLMIAVGIVFAITGYYVYRGSTLARRVAQFNALLCYVWIVAYAASVYQNIDAIGTPGDLLGEPARTVVIWIWLIVGSLIPAVFPTGLLYLLSRPSYLQKIAAGSR